MRALVYGLAVAGTSTVRALLERGYDVAAADDHIDQSKQDLADALGIDLLPVVGTGASAKQLLRGVDILSPAPGVPEGHDIIVAAEADDIPVLSEIELAYRWEQDRAGGPRPILAITGTDGKTTTTDLTVAMLRASGKRSEAVGNTDIPMVDSLSSDLEVFVVECTSFRLAWTQRFRADAAVWLNLAPDHLNWHRSMDSYEAAKARIFDLQSANDVAIGFSSDPAVVRHLQTAPGRHRTFGESGADYYLDGSMLTGPMGPIIDASEMKRRLPHDITNALAASALVLETGLADTDAIGSALADFEAPPHRLEPVGEGNGLAWYNDSKATTPHAASVAIQAFDSLVLIAGGSSKGLDLSAMAANAQNVRAVVAIGDSADEIDEIFHGITTVVHADSMESAVELADQNARPGDAVVLSPGCASFDWYSGYPARGDDFRTLVHDLLGTVEATK